jgi:hypothetical protein
MKRIVQPELLDTLPPDNPRAVHSRRDLRRINWWMHNPAIMASALETNLPPASQQITELGAGDGCFLLKVAQKMSARWPDVNATLLDLQKNVTRETLAAYAEFGWRAEAVVADVFDWSPSGKADGVLIANLFLHHFEDAQLSGLLRKISQNARLFVAIEPHRSALPSLVEPLLWLIGCNDVTRHDAVVSIRAGFAGEEISALWPDQKNWQLTERRAGLFSHLFIARQRQ